MKLILPLPPPLNAAYRSGLTKWGKPYTYKSNKAKKWQKEAEETIAYEQSGGKKFEGQVEVFLHLFIKVDRDIDSSQKLLFDSLEAVRIIENDRQIYDLHIFKRFDKENPRIEVLLYAKDN